MITAAGLGSGLDINGLVSQLVAAERAGSDLQLNRESSKINTKLSALGSLKSAIAGLQSSLTGLNTLDNFGKRTVTSSNADAVSATVNNVAVPNTYTLEVNQLARAHGLASPAFANSDTAIGTGTLTFRFGTTTFDAEQQDYGGFVLNPDSKTATLTIDDSNNTLSGVMNAINTAKFGVRASIINDGSGDRLLLTSEKTGEANSIEIMAADDDGSNIDAGGLSALAFNADAVHMEQTSAASNAQFKVNGLSVTSQENTSGKAIPGMSLSLKEVTTGPVTLTVDTDTGAAVTAFSAFIAGYNQFRATINTLTGYNAATSTAGVLLGDFTVRSVVQQVENVLRNAVDGVTGSFSNLSEIGLKTNSNGTYTLDAERFKQALQDEPLAVSQLFAALGSPTDPEIRYSSANSATRTGNYSVNITTAASSGYNTGAGVLPDFAQGGTLQIDDGNNNLSLKVDGIDIGEITLTAGEYDSGEALASELQSRINGADKLSKANRTVSVVWDAQSRSLQILSTTFGSSSRIEITGVDTVTAATLGFETGIGTVGVDVAGTIDGREARGAGKLLTGGAGSGAEGLSILVSGTTLGDRGTVNFSRGVSDQLKTLLGKMLENEGSLEGRIDNLEARKKSVEDKRARMELRWKSVETRFRTQFTALDTLISNLQSTSSYLDSQLKNLPKPNSVGNG